LEEAVSVCVVDDDESVLRSLQRILQLEGYKVWTFASAEEFFDRSSPPEPFCIVTDLRMPGLSGTEFQQRVRATGSSVPFVFLTGHGGVSDAVRAMKDGAVDFLEKPVDTVQLIDAIRTGLQRYVAGRKMEESVAEWSRLFATLSPRERQVSELVAEGLLNKEIAAQLGTSEKTVKVQRGRAMKKLKARSTAALVNILNAVRSRRR
jgi:FixJ family two-component response regulator